jgi:hypothetical protein
MFNLITRTVALRTGFPLDHVQAVARGLQKSGAWGKDSNKAVTNLLLAVLAEAEPGSAASVARHYWELQTEGYPKLGQMLEEMLASFLEHRRTAFSVMAYRSAFEIYDYTTPAAVLRVPCGITFAEIVYRDEAAWDTRSVRRANFLEGKTIFDIAADIGLKGEARYVY